MPLRSILVNNFQVEFVINKIKEQSRTLATDVISAYNLFCDNNPELNEVVLKRLDRVFVMCKYMDPEAEDVISMLLFHDNLVNKASMNTFMRYFSEKRYKGYHNYMTEACRNAAKSNPKDITWSREDCIGYYIMMRVSDKMFNRLMKSYKATDTTSISHAYYMARTAYEWDTSKSGEPNIVHSIRVAEILEEIGVESSVIAAALLHDVVAETTYTLDDIERACRSSKVARYVDAVTSVHREYAESKRSSEYQCDKAKMDQRSIQKLVSHLNFSEDMIFALYIKAADRIHNLRTIDSMSSTKTHDKIDETLWYYLPLFKVYKLNYFVQKIEDLMWRATDMDRYTKMQAKYDDMLLRNREFLDEFKTILTAHTETQVNYHADILGRMGYDVQICERLLTPYEVYNHIKNSGGTIGNLSKRIDKRFVPICDIDIVADPRNSESDLDTFVTGFIKMFENKIAGTGRTIIDFSKSEKAFVFDVEDHYRNVFRCRIILRADYEEHKMGIYLKDASNALEEEPIEKPEKITIRLRNDNPISLPTGATVIDAAFAIHEEIGFTVKSATINGKKASIYDVLQENDKIIIEADTRRVDGVTQKDAHIPHVRIGWLNWVVTKRARKKIIDFLTDKYYKFEGDDPKNESKAQTPVVEMVADKILEELSSTT